MTKTILVAAMALFLNVVFTGSAEAKKVKLWASGTALNSNAADLDENMTGYNSHLRGGGNLGPFTMTNAGDVADWDGVSYCDFDSAGNPIAVPLVYLDNSTVMRTVGGDLLFIEMNSSPPSIYCFNFIDSTQTFELYADIVGGTGTFKGATGSLHFTGQGTVLRNLSGFELTASGDIYLQRGNKDLNNDDDD